MATLGKALHIAAQVHEAQTDRYGAPYILHPLRVMMHMGDENAKIVAILHDVIEDSDMELQDLRREGFNEEAIAAVDSLTKRDGEAYFDYINRLKPNTLAAKVKLADLQDNMDLTRMPDSTQLDADRFARYHGAWTLLRRDAG